MALNCKQRIGTTLPRLTPSVQELRRRLSYDPGTGIMTWRARPTSDFSDERYAHSWNTRRVGKPAESLSESGYKVVRFNGALYRAHRLIWKLVTGVDPIEQVDHINLDRGDNRWSNLREATRSQNAFNTAPRSRAGMPKGVSRQRGGNFYALIMVRGRRIYLGTHRTLDAAAAAYSAAARQFVGEFARTR